MQPGMRSLRYEILSFFSFALSYILFYFHWKLFLQSEQKDHEPRLYDFPQCPSSAQG